MYVFTIGEKTANKNTNTTLPKHSTDKQTLKINRGKRQKRGTTISGKQESE